MAKKSDLIFTLNATSAGFPAMLAARLFKKKLLVKVVGDYAWEIAINKKKTFLLLDDFQKTKRRGWISILHKLQIATCKKAEGIIVPSQYLAHVVSGWGVSRNKITVIHNGVDFMADSTSKEEARKKIAVSGNIILSVGRLVPWKGFRMLIKLMPKLLETNQFTRLVIVGDGPDKGTLQTMITNLNLARKVYLVGKKSQQELALYMAASDLFVLNTGYEGFSHQILEAMAGGLPVITTASGGNREIVKQGVNGFMVKYNDEFNLVEAIKTVWTNQELKEVFIRNGRDTAKRFSFDKMYAETLGVLLR